MIYLDNAATSFPKPGSCFAGEQEECFKLSAYPGLGGCDATVQSQVRVQVVRDLFDSRCVPKRRQDSGLPGLHCAPLVRQDLGIGEDGSIRASLGLYNTIADVEALLAALSDMVRSKP